MLMEAAQSDDQTVQKALHFLDTLLAGYHACPCAVRFWDGTVWNPTGDEPRFTMVLQHPGALRRMFLPANEVTLGEAYIYDDFDVEGDIEAGVSFADYLFELRLGLLEKLRKALNLLSLPARERPGSCARLPALAGKAHSRARFAGSHLPLQRLQRLLPALAGRADGLLLRLFRDARRFSRGGAGAQARLSLPQAAPEGGRATARHRLRLGRADPARGQAWRGSARYHPQRAAGRTGQRTDPGGRPCRTLPGGGPRLPGGR